MSRCSSRLQAASRRKRVSGRSTFDGSRLHTTRRSFEQTGLHTLSLVKPGDAPDLNLRSKDERNSAALTAYTDLDQVFADDELPRKIALRAHQIGPRSVARSDVGQHQRFGPGGLGHLADVVDRCV
jgi:hypothetical protein